MIRTNIEERLQEGRQIARKKYTDMDATKLGILRAGNSGIMSEDGEVAGSCHRVAHLRQLGIELDPPTDSNLIMFQVGTSNEDIIFEDLMHTAAAGEIILREEEIPIEWFTSNGTRVTGRPDMVLCVVEETPVTAEEAASMNGSGPEHMQAGALLSSAKPVLGLELKSVASVWTSRSVLFEGEPKLAHLAQAGHYAWKLNVPFKLIYKQYALQSMPDFAAKFFPAQGKPLSEHIDYNPQGKPKAIKPFEIVYDLEYGQNGKLRYRREGTKSWTESIVSREDIERYYEFVSKMGPDQNLGPRPLTLGTDGEAKKFTNCAYCPLDKTCKTEKVYADWLNAVKKLKQIAEGK
jgi:hypothetical protein